MAKAKSPKKCVPRKEGENFRCLVPVNGKACGHIVSSDSGIYCHLKFVHGGKTMVQGETYERSAKEITVAPRGRKTKVVEKAKSGKVQITDAVRERVVELYANQNSQRQIAEQLGIGKTTVGKILKDAELAAV